MVISASVSRFLGPEDSTPVREKQQADG